MTEKLNWVEIKKRFDREWIELVEYDWPESETHPRAGIVRVHAKSRAEFHQTVAKLPPVDSAILYVGMPATFSIPAAL